MLPLWRSRTRPASACASAPLGLDRRVQAIAGGAVVTLAAAAAVSLAITRGRRHDPATSRRLTAPMDSEPQIPDAERERIRQRDRKREQRMVVDNAGIKRVLPAVAEKKRKARCVPGSRLAELPAQHFGVGGARATAGRLHGGGDALVCGHVAVHDGRPRCAVRAGAEERDPFR